MSEQTTPEVMIDGIRYVPAKQVVLNREQVLRLLVEEYMGEEPEKPLEWFERMAQELYVWVDEDPGSEDDETSTIAGLLDRLALERIKVEDD